MPLPAAQQGRLRLPGPDAAAQLRGQEPQPPVPLVELPHREQAVREARLDLLLLGERDSGGEGLAALLQVPLLGLVMGKVGGRRGGVPCEAGRGGRGGEKREIEKETREKEQRGREGGGGGALKYAAGEAKKAESATWPAHVATIRTEEERAVKPDQFQHAVNTQVSTAHGHQLRRYVILYPMGWHKSTTKKNKRDKTPVSEQLQTLSHVHTSIHPSQPQQKRASY